MRLNPTPCYEVALETTDHTSWQMFSFDEQKDALDSLGSHKQTLRIYSSSLSEAFSNPVIALFSQRRAWMSRMRNGKRAKTKLR